jgi:hypothetical protein
MPLGVSRHSLNLANASGVAPPAGPVFGAGTAKPVWGIETSTGDGSPFNFTVPDVVESGDLILVLSAARDDRNVTFPSGWIELRDVKNGGLSAAHIGYKISDGSEGGQTFAMIPQASGGYTNTVLVIRGGVPASNTISPAIVTTTATPDTPAAPGTGDSLYISFIGGRNLNSITRTATPAGMELFNFQWSNGAFVAIAGIYSTATSYDPAAWGLSASSVIVGWTIRV